MSVWTRTTRLVTNERGHTAATKRVYLQFFKRNRRFMPRDSSYRSDGRSRGPPRDVPLDDRRSYADDHGNRVNRRPERDSPPPPPPPEDSPPPPPPMEEPPPPPPPMDDIPPPPPPLEEDDGLKLAAEREALGLPVAFETTHKKPVPGNLKRVVAKITVNPKRQFIQYQNKPGGHKTPDKAKQPAGRGGAG